MSDNTKLDNTEPAKTVVLCPTCSKEIVWSPEQKWRPFCSERCKLIDLGEWANESYSVSGESENDFEINPKED